MSKAACIKEILDAGVMAGASMECLGVLALTNPNEKTEDELLLIRDFYNSTKRKADRLMTELTTE